MECSKHMLVVVLTHESTMIDLIKVFAENEIHGSTIIDSRGMAGVIENENFDDLPMFGVLRHMMEGDEEFADNYTVFTVLDDADLAKAKGLVKQTCGNLNKPNAGIMFTLPVDSVEGVTD